MAGVKDKRVVAKKGATDLASIIDGVMSGERKGRPGAESAAFQVVVGLIEAYLMGEGKLSDDLRELVDELMKPTDSLRKDIPREAWSAMWPTLNTLSSARRESVRTMERLKAAASPPPVTTPPMQEEQHERREEEGAGEAGPEAGAGVLGAGGAPGGEGGEGAGGAR